MHEWLRATSFKKIYLKLSSAKLRPFGFGLNVLRCATAAMQQTHEFLLECSTSDEKEKRGQ